MIDSDNSDVLLRVEDHLGRITLNRPRRINALTTDMIRRIRATLADWRVDPTVGAVLIDGAGERGLCAGADIRELHEGLGLDGPAAFLADEYRMNLELSRYPKPVVAYMSGLTLGGGVGISGHCRVRVVSEDSAVGMPETAIGLCPDVGGLYLLSRAPGEIGTHAALTGARLGPGDAIASGMADHFVRRADLGALTEELRSGRVPAVMGGGPPPAPELAAARSWIDRCYAGDDVARTLRALRNDGASAAGAAADVLAAMAPTAVTVTLRALRLARSMTLEQVLEQDYRLGVRFLPHPDLAEGIRAQVIDKDRQPRWKPARLDEVSDADVDGFFARLPADQRWRADG